LVGLFEVDVPYLASFSVLFAMGGICLALSLLFRLKSRALKRLPKNVAPNVFDKTFSVFNPYPDKKETIGMLASSIALSPLLVFVMVMILTFTVMLRLLEMGLMLSLSIGIVCLGLMMVAEASETRMNANSIMKAIRNGDELANGDLTVLSLVKELLPKLTAYYLCLGTVLVASSLTLSYLIPAFFFAFSQFIGALVGTTMFAGILAPILASSLCAISGLMLFVASRTIESKVFGLQPSGLLTSPFSASVRVGIIKEKLAHVLDSKPEEATW
jgi:hypothetical protein